MDLRILRYFLAVAEESNITRAAERLHVSQPALSTQLNALEEELGHKLFERGARGITLTDKGILLKRRANDLVTLAEHIETEVKAEDAAELVGTIAIGAGETPAFRHIAHAATRLRRDNPRLDFALSSGNGEDILARLKEGTLDLAVMVGPGRYDGFNHLTLPYLHHWGLLLHRDSPLAKKKHITPRDAKSLPLICSRQAMVRESLSGWFGCPFEKLDVVATYNLLYNAAALVEQGLGAAISIDGVTPLEFSPNVVYRPFSPALTCDIYLAWRKNVPLSPAAAALVDLIRKGESSASY